MKKTKTTETTKITKTTTKKRPSGRATRPVPPDLEREPLQPADPRAEKDAPGSGPTAAFKAGKDL